MKYLCLVYLEEAKLRAVPDKECMACGDGFRKSGMLVAAEALQPVATAATVRVRNGKVSITDGPFAETKELIAGYTIIQARSREEAIEWTKRFPNPMGRRERCEIEVRQLYELEDLGGPDAAIERFREIGIG